jgi:hypothetical protein
VRLKGREVRAHASRRRTRDDPTRHDRVWCNEGVADVRRRGMSERRVVAAAAVAWGWLGGVLAVSGLRDSNPDAKVLLAAVTGVAVAAAVGGAVAIVCRRDVLASALLVVSVVMPTFGAAALNVVPLVLAFAVSRVAHQRREHAVG